jgi:hypothetical protein
MKVIRLTESDLERIVKRIIKEDNGLWMSNTYDQNLHTQEEMNTVWHDLNTMAVNYGDEIFDLMELTFNEDAMSVEDFVNRLPERNFDNDYIVSVLKQIQIEGI